jgi:hypothetical protein
MQALSSLGFLSELLFSQFSRTCVLQDFIATMMVVLSR